jgi:4-hydroxy-2-oxoheptanedioate aldolase
MTNVFKETLLTGKPQVGLWMSLASPIAAEALSHVGFDWLLCDTEHAPLEVSGALPVLQAIGARCPVIVRVAWNDRVLLKRHLDQGATTLLVPYVETGDDAAEAVASIHYPPRGCRGVAGGTRASRYGTDTGYLLNAGEDLCLVVQVETGKALTNLEDIAGTPGVDAVFIGPSDLAASLGHIGNPAHPEVQEKIRQAIERLGQMRVPVGVFATGAESACRYVDWGASFVAAGVEMGLMMSASRDLLNKVRNACAE